MDIPSDKIRDWLLEESDDDDVYDATSEEEDNIEMDNVENTDDSDNDPTWEPDPVHSDLERILNKRQRMSALECCDEEVSSDSDNNNEYSAPLATSEDRPSNNYTSMSENAANVTDGTENAHQSLSGSCSTSSTEVASSRGRPRKRGRPGVRLHGSQSDSGGSQRGTIRHEFQPGPSTALLPSGNEPLVLVPNKNIIRGKDRTPWSTSCPQSQNIPVRNIVHVRRGPTNNARNANTPRECFDLFITDEMKRTIIVHTNEQAQRMRANYKELKSTTSNVTMEELDAFLGILLFSAVMKDNHLPSRSMFDSTLCGSRYRAVMSRERFEFLLLAIRFDDKDTRQERSNEDPLAPIRDIWDLFVKNCQDNYKPSSYVTIDEQLLAFRGKCRFRMYIPNKPAKYGLKLVMACDTATSYMFNAIPYTGKKTYRGELPIAEYLVKELTKPIHGSNRNLTCDNWFTSIKLAQDLLEPPFNLTYVGTVRSNKREIPAEMKNSKTRPVGTSIFCFDREKTLVSYKPKPNKVVFLVSTMHSNSELNEHTKKPWIIHTYNTTKGAVDTLDQICHNVSCSRKTRRWPLCLFFGVQNIAYVNSYVIYCLNAELQSEKPKNRKNFCLQLCDELVFPHMRTRLRTPTLQRNIRALINGFLGIQEECERRPVQGARKTCFYCPSVKRRMTTSYCNHCRQAMCGEHRAFCCVRCDEEK